MANTLKVERIGGKRKDGSPWTAINIVAVVNGVSYKNDKPIYADGQSSGEPVVFDTINGVKQ